MVLLVGTDGGIPMKFHCQSTWNELDVWVRIMGIPPMTAIRGATCWGAVMMGVSDRWGTVSAGKYAARISSPCGRRPAAISTCCRASTSS